MIECCCSIISKKYSIYKLKDDLVDVVKVHALFLYLYNRHTLIKWIKMRI